MPRCCCCFMTILRASVCGLVRLHERSSRHCFLVSLFFVNPSLYFFFRTHISITCKHSDVLPCKASLAAARLGVFPCAHLMRLRTVRAHPHCSPSLPVDFSHSHYSGGWAVPIHVSTQCTTSQEKLRGEREYLSGYVLFLKITYVQFGCQRPKYFS